MAFIGMQHVVAATLDAHTAGSEPTYDAGMVVGKAIQANLTITRGSNPLRADDVDAEDDNGITAMSVTIGVDDVDEETQVYLGLLDKVTTGSGQTEKIHYLETAKSANYVGLGYMRVRRKNGVTTYQGVWIYKALFGFTNETSDTRQESINWQTPTLEGKAVALKVAADSDVTFRKKANFTSDTECIAWLNELAGITT